MADTKTLKPSVADRQKKKLKSSKRSPIQNPSVVLPVIRTLNFQENEGGQKITEDDEDPAMDEDPEEQQQEDLEDDVEDESQPPVITDEKAKKSTKRVAKESTGESPMKNSSVVNVTNKAQVQMEFLESVDAKAIQKFETFIKKCRANEIEIDRVAYIKEHVLTTIAMFLQPIDIKFTDWKSYSDEEFFRVLFRAFGPADGHEKDAVYLEPVERMIYAAKNTHFRINFETPASYADYVSKILKIYGEFVDGEFSADDEVQMAKAILDHLPDHAEGKEKITIKTIRDEVMLEAKADRNTVKKVLLKITGSALNAITAHRAAKRYGLLSTSDQKKTTYTAEEKFAYKERKQAEAIARRAGQNKTNPTEPVVNPNKDGKEKAGCKGCGKLHSGTCNLAQHPDYNKETKPWKESTKGIAWAAKGQATLPALMCLDPKDQATWKPPPKPAPKANQNKTSESIDVHTEYLNSVTDITNDPYKHLLPCTINFHKHRIHCRGLMDTGAEHANYMSGELAAKLKYIGMQVQEQRSRVYGATSSLACIEIKEKIIVPVTFYNEKTFCEEAMRLEFHIMEECKYDIIIGLKSIKMYDLIFKSESLFRCKENTNLQPFVRPLVRPETVVPGQDAVLNPSGRNSMLGGTQKVEHMSKFIDQIEEANGIPFKDENPPWERVVDGDEQFTGIPEKL